VEAISWSNVVCLKGKGRHVEKQVWTRREPHIRQINGTKSCMCRKQQVSSPRACRDGRCGLSGAEPYGVPKFQAQIRQPGLRAPAFIIGTNTGYSLTGIPGPITWLSFQVDSKVGHHAGPEVFDLFLDCLEF
jgi:hypothetical protein